MGFVSATVSKMFPSCLCYGIRKICCMILAFMLDDNALTELSAQLDARRKLIDDLSTGILTTNQLIGKLQASLKTADDQIATLTKQLSDNSTVQDVTSQLQAKNTQLQTLVQKFGGSISALAPK